MGHCETIHADSAVALSPLLSIEPQDIVRPLVQVARLVGEPSVGRGIYLNDSSLHCSDAQALPQLVLDCGKPLPVLILFGPYLHQRNAITNGLSSLPGSNICNTSCEQHANIDAIHRRHLIGESIFPGLERRQKLTAILEITVGEEQEEWSATSRPEHSSLLTSPVPDSNRPDAQPSQRPSSSSHRLPSTCTG